MQSLNFGLMHIPGKDMGLPDYMSRMIKKGANHAELSRIHEHEEELLAIPTFEEVMKQVHGGRKLHYGAHETWRRAKSICPKARITIQAVLEYVKTCPICQKTRDLQIKGLPSKTLHLKPDSYRKRVGVDHMTISPADKSGNKCAIMTVEHFSHFPQVYPAQSYDADTVAKILFKHYCTFGMYDEVISDPGSALLADAVLKLNQWLGIEQKVSLVGRHESNGCEGPIKQFLHHLSTLALEERLKNQWSDDSVLPLINFAMCSFPTSETGGYTPFQLKYGTHDANYFRLPDTDGPLDPDYTQFVRNLDENLRIVRDKSAELQKQVIEERCKHDGEHQVYEPGDLVLFNPREKPTSMLPAKLYPRMLGPYRVLSHVQNDVSLEHVVTGAPMITHVSRLIPFIGSDSDAYDVAKIDQDQYVITEISYFIGNVHIRKSLEFHVVFEDSESKMIPYNPDLASAEPFKQYVLSKSYLFPLRYTYNEAKKQKTRLNRLPITKIVPYSAHYLHLRYYDKENLEWYDTLKFEYPNKDYLVHIDFANWSRPSRTEIEVSCPILNHTFIITNYEICMYVVTYDKFHAESMIIITDTDEILYSKLIPFIH
jgi:hypothetical protein